MNKKIVALAFVSVLLLSIVPVTQFIASVRATRTWTVDDDGPADFHTIQEAINAASDGDAIQVASGIYYENVIVNKTLSLIGEDASATIIDANQTLGTPVTIVANNVYINGFTVRNSGRRPHEGILLGYPGIFIDGCKGSIITGNIISKNYYDGVRLANSSNCMIFNNTIKDNGCGIRIYGSSKNNTLSGNTISYNNEGIMLYGPSNNNTISGNTLSPGGIELQSSSNNLISGNTARASSPGIGLFRGSNSNRISNNTVSKCNYHGILLSSSSRNVLSGNNMSENGYNFAVYGALDTPSDWNNYVDMSNTVNEKPVYYLMDVDNLVLDGETNAGTIYLINCKNATIRDLTLIENGIGVFFMNTTNSKIENVSAKYNQYGIVLGSSNNNTLVGNTAYGNDGHGIWLSRSNGNVLSGNTASRNYDYDHIIDANGIYLYCSTNNTISCNTALGNLICGIRLESSGNNVLSGNTFSENYECGIMLESSSNNLISSNVASKNYDYGICLYSSSNSNTISGNTVSNNRDCGVMLKTSSNNTLYHNNFINNKVQVESDESINVWDNGYPSGGNYWSDYKGTDMYSGPYQNETGSDGIGDEAYVIDKYNRDNYPIMSPRLLHDIAVWLEAPTSIGPGGSSLLNATVVNLGTSNETNVKLLLLIDGSIVESKVIPFLQTGSSYTLNYLWTPITKGIHNVTAYAPPLTWEEYIENNKASKFVVFTKYEHDLSVNLERPSFITTDIPSLFSATVYNIGSSNETNLELQILINGTVVESVTIPELASASSYTLDYSWTPTVEGVYNVTAHVIPIPGEVDFSDNVQSLNVTAWRPPPILTSAAVIGFSPEEANIGVGYNFTINVTIANVTDLFSWQVALYYRNDILEATEATEGPFLKTGGDTLFVTSPSETGGVWNDYNATHGRIFLGCTILGDLPGVNGSGVLATIKFKATALGCCILKLDRKETIVIDSDQNSMLPEVRDGYITVTEPLPGDLNGDGIVNILDLAIFGKAFGSYPGHPRWNPIADINKDNTTNIIDLVLIAKNFGKTIDSRVIDVYTHREPNSGRGLNQPSDAFAPQEEVILYAYVTYNGDPVEEKIVAFEIHGPINPVENVSFTRTAVTNAGGVATVSFRIGWPDVYGEEVVFGVWNVVAIVEIADVMVEDTLTFEVGWIVELLRMETIDVKNVSKTSFMRGEHVCFRLSVRNIAMAEKVATLIIDVYDNSSVSLGQIVLADERIPPGVKVYFIDDLLIPTWACLGVGEVYANAYTALPVMGGVPWCPQVSTTFLITKLIVHDVAVVSVVPSMTEAVPCQVVNITVVVRNEGDVSESFEYGLFGQSC